VQVGEHELAGHRIRLQHTEIGDDPARAAARAGRAPRLAGPRPKPNEVTKSTRSRTRAGSGRTTTMTSLQEAAISGAPPAPGSRTLGCVVAADHGGVDVAVLVDLGGAQEADVDRPGCSQ